MMKAQVLLSINILLLFVFALPDLLASADEPAADWQSLEKRRIETIERIRPTVAAIFPLSGEGGGSGVLISSDGFCVTNYHVVQPCGTAAKVGLNDGKLYDAVVVGIDPVGDVALIQLLGRSDFPFARLGDSDTVRQGDSVLVLGNPFVLADDFQPSASFGIVSGVHRYQYPADTLLEYADCIQTDASVNPGNSGGPMFNLAGEVVGINGRCSFDKRGRVNVGVGYAISINQIKRFLPFLKAGRLCDHATLGAIAAADSSGRPTIDTISLRSSIWEQGLRQGDVILQFGSRRVLTVNELKNALGTYPKEWRAALQWRQSEENQLDSESKDGEMVRTAVVRLPGVHTEMDLREKAEPKKPKAPDWNKLPKNMPEEQKEKLKKLFEQRIKAANPEIPDAVKKSFESRPGYVNYYYNRLAKQAVIERWNKVKFEMTTAINEKSGEWTVQGFAVEDHAALTLQASAAGLSLKLPEVEVKLRSADDLTLPSDPADAGALAPALFCWYKAVVGGKEWADSVCYLGAFPVDSTGTIFDCLEGIIGKATVQWFFNPQTGELVRIEFFDSENVYRPWAVQLSEYQRGMPTKIRVTHGQAAFLDFERETLDVKR